MVFAIVAIGESTKDDLLHLLNDLRNLNENAYVLINYDLNINFYRFNNVTLVKTDKDNWTCFRKFELFKYIFEHTNHTLIYSLDGDSRYVDFRESKYDRIKYLNLLDSIDFDLMYTWDLKGDNGANTVKSHLQSPDINENKEVRNYKYGHSVVLDYLKTKFNNLEEVYDLGTPLESAMMIRKNGNIMHFFEEMIIFGDIVEQADKDYGRKHVAHGSSYAISIFAKYCSINLLKNFIPGHYFKPNFTNEVYLWGQNMDINFKIY